MFFAPTRNLSVHPHDFSSLSLPIQSLIPGIASPPTRLFSGSPARTPACQAAAVAGPKLRHFANYRVMHTYKIHSFKSPRMRTYAFQREGVPRVEEMFSACKRIEVPLSYLESHRFTKARSNSFGMISFRKNRGEGADLRPLIQLPARGAREITGREHLFRGVHGCILPSRPESKGRVSRAVAMR
jgi:hypothetical protein